MSGGWVGQRLDFPCGCHVQRFGDNGTGRIDHRCPDHTRRDALAQDDHDQQIRANERELMTDHDQRFAHCEHCPEGCDDQHQIACNWNATPLCREGSRRLA